MWGWFPLTHTHKHTQWVFQNIFWLTGSKQQDLLNQCPCLRWWVFNRTMAGGRNVSSPFFIIEKLQFSLQLAKRTKAKTDVRVRPVLGKIMVSLWMHPCGPPIIQIIYIWSCRAGSLCPLLNRIINVQNRSYIIAVSFILSSSLYYLFLIISKERDDKG